MAGYGMNDKFTIGSDFGCKYNATHVSGFTINNGFAPEEGVTIADVDSVESLIVSVAPSVATDTDITSAP